MVRMEPAEPESDWMLRLSVDDGIATLTLDRPDKLNAWSWEASRQLGRRADQIRFDEAVRGVVLRAGGGAVGGGWGGGGGVAAGGPPGAGGGPGAGVPPPGKRSATTTRASAGCM